MESVTTPYSSTFALTLSKSSAFTNSSAPALLSAQTSMASCTPKSSFSGVWISTRSKGDSSSIRRACPTLRALWTG